MMFNCLIVDDERPALKLLDAYIQKLPHLKIVAACENGIEAFAALQEHQVDILFIDIQMPRLTGLELLKTLTVKPQVIITTAYRDYAVEGFALDVRDYLVKPFSFERFLQAVHKATSALDKPLPQTPPSGSTPDSSTKQSPLEGHIFLKTRNKSEKVAFSDILYLESMREYIGIHTHDKRYVIHQSMNGMADKLPESDFMRVHRSYFVNLNHISAIKGNIIQIKDKEIPVGGSYRKSFFEKIDRF